MSSLCSLNINPSALFILKAESRAKRKGRGGQAKEWGNMFQTGAKESGYRPLQATFGKIRKNLGPHVGTANVAVGICVVIDLSFIILLGTLSES